MLLIATVHVYCIVIVAQILTTTVCPLKIETATFSAVNVLRRFRATPSTSKAATHSGTDTKEHEVDSPALTTPRRPRSRSASAETGSRRRRRRRSSVPRNRASGRWRTWQRRRRRRRAVVDLRRSWPTSPPDLRRCRSPRPRRSHSRPDSSRGRTVFRGIRGTAS